MSSPSSSSFAARLAARSNISQPIIDTAQLELRDFCGSGRLGYADGQSSLARFNGICGMCVLPDGNVVVSETNNSSIRLINIHTNRVSTLTKNVLLYPKSICYMENKQAILICDSGHHKIRLFDVRKGKLAFFAGSGQKGYKDGRLVDAQFDNPSGICTYRNAIFVSDTNNHCIRKIEGDHVTTIAGGGGFGSRIDGYRDGPAKNALFKFPTGICFDIDGSLLVSDSMNNCIRKVSPDFSTVTTIGGDNYLNNPEGICLTDNGDIYVADSGNNRISLIERNLTNTVLVLCGKKDQPGHLNGSCKAALLNLPTNIIPVGQGRYLISDFGNNLIRILERGPHSHSSDSPLHAATPKTIRKISPEKKFLQESYFSNSTNTLNLSALDLDEDNSKLFSDKMRMMSRKLRLSRALSADISSDSVYDGPLDYYEVISRYEEQISRIFIYYTSSSRNRAEIVELSSLKFLNFIKDCRILTNESEVSSESFVGYGRPLGANDIYLVYEEAVKHASTQTMNIDEFVNAICLVAGRKYGKENEISSLKDLIVNHENVRDYVERLLEYYILPNAKQLELEPSPSELSSRDVITLWGRYEDKMSKIFNFYAHSRQTRRELSDRRSYQRGLSTLNIEEFYIFARDFEIFPTMFNKSVLTQLFQSCCQGNYIPKVGVVKTGENCCLDFWEFLDLLGRIAIMRYSEPPLSDIYQSTEAKIEALLEHMHLSAGRKRFASEIGGRLFPNLSSPLKHQVMISIQNKLQQEKRENNLNFSSYSNKQRYTITNSYPSQIIVEHSSPDRSTILSPDKNKSSSVLSSPVLNNWTKRIKTGRSFSESHILSSPKGILKTPKSLQEWKNLTIASQDTTVKCMSDDAKLYEHDSKSNAWKLLCEGTVSIWEAFSPTNSTPSQYELRFVEKLSNNLMSYGISQKNLPNVELNNNGEYLHVWRRGPGHIFSPDIAFAIKFRNAEYSNRFSMIYDHIKSTAMPSHSNPDTPTSRRPAPIRIADYNPSSDVITLRVDSPGPSRKNSLPSTPMSRNRNNSIQSDNLTPRRASFDPFTSNPSTPRRGSLTPQHSNTPRRGSLTPKSGNAIPSSPSSARSLKVTTTSPAVTPESERPLTPISLRQRAIVKTQDERLKPSFYESDLNGSLRTADIQKYEHDVSRLVEDYMERYLGALRKEKQFETVFSTIAPNNNIHDSLNSIMNSSQSLGQTTQLDSRVVNSGETGLHYLISKNGETITDGLINRIQLASALNIVGTGDNSDYQQERVAELAKAYIEMDPMLLKDCTSMRQYYQSILACLESKIYSDIRMRDNLGGLMFLYKTGFCVVSNERCTVELSLLAHSFLVDNLSRIQSCQVILSYELISAQSTQIIYDEERGVAQVNIPLQIPAFETLAKGDAEAVSGSDSFLRKSTEKQQLSSEVFGETVQIYQFHVSLNFNILGERESLLVQRDIQLFVFPNQQAIDRNYGKLREYGKQLSDNLPSAIKPLSIFCSRAIQT